MSDKLIVEFYCANEPEVPVACVLACHGGDNPSSAATTLSDFFDSVSAASEPRYDDAGVLAARFVVWQAVQEQENDRDSLEFNGVVLIPFQTSHGYQTVRVYACKHRPYVHCVEDEWTTCRELIEASIILRQDNMGPFESVAIEA
jgi:hypothetical protein